MTHDFQNILDAVLEGIVVLDEAGRVREINSEACRILETSADAANGVEIDHLVGRDDCVTRLAHQVMETARPSILDDTQIGRRFDTDLDVDVSVSPLQGLGGITGVVITLRDRTVRNSLGEIVSEREQLTSYGHIAAGIAHEVKNPLSGIRGAAELIEKRAADGRTRTTAELIVREVDRITALVDELMVFARGEDLDTRPINVHQVLDGVIHLLSMDPVSSKVETKRYYDPSIPDVDGDDDRLTQVFLNLARNAFQAMEDTGGTLIIRTRMTLEHRLCDTHGHLIPTVEISVEDSGPGIEPNVLKRLATPFFTTKAKGTGLGLAVSRHWITRHGGNLRFASELGRGTSVRVTLPLRRADLGLTEQTLDSTHGIDS